VIDSAKRSAVIGVRQRPIVWKSTVEYFDICFKHIGSDMELNEWLEIHNEWEVKSLSFDPPKGRWLLIAQRPSA